MLPSASLREARSLFAPSPSTSESSVAVRLRAAGCVFAEVEAHLLVTEASTPADLDAMVNRRIAGLPLEQILGWAEFSGLRISVQPGVFVPRLRTEFLTRRAIQLAKRRHSPIVLDLCCGSGAIGVAIAAHVSPLDLIAADIHPAAVECARRNIAGRGVVFEGDLFEPIPFELRGRIDIVVANAPYVPSTMVEMMPPEARLHEPRLTFDGGEDGLDLHRRIAGEAPSWLTSGGHLLMECSERQAPIVVEIFSTCGLAVQVARREESDSTVVIGTNSIEVISA